MAKDIRDMDMFDLQTYVEYIQSCFKTGQMPPESDDLRKDCITALQLVKIVLSYHDLLAHELMERKKKEEKGIRPQGKWEFVSRNCWKCSYCQELTNEGKNFCPHCGAEMEGEDNG